MNDATLEREIERALAVDPSPEFLVRVRARIADEPAPATRGFAWLFAGVATAAAAAAIVLTMRSVSPVGQPGSVALLASRSIGSPIVVPPVSPAKAAHYAPNAIGRSDRSQYVVSGFSRTSTSRSPAPLFDARETTALQRLIADVRDARVDLEPLTKEAPMPVPALGPLVISPIVIEPLASSGVEGERP